MSQRKNSDPDLLTVGQVAKFLKIRPSTVRRWLTQGLPVERVDQRKIRIRRTTLVTALTAGVPLPIYERRTPPSWRVLHGGRS